MSIGGWNELTNKICNVVLYGAGMLGRELRKILAAYSEIQIVCFIDSNYSLVGGTINDIPVYNPNKIVKEIYDYVLLCTKNTDYKQQMKEILLNLGVEEHKIVEDTFFTTIQKSMNKASKVKFVRDIIWLMFQKECRIDGVELGDFTWYAPHIHGHEKCANVKIGKFSGFASDVVVYRGGEYNWKFASLYGFGDLFYDVQETPYPERSKGDVVIGNDVMLYSGVKVLSGVSVGDGAVIAANSLVCKSIPPYAIAWGVPAKVVMYRFDDVAIKKLLEMRWWDWEYKLIYDAIPLLRSDKIDDLYDYYVKNYI